MRIILLGLLLLAGYLCTSPVAATELDCTEHPIFCSLKKVNPWIEEGFALQLSNELSRGCKLTGFDCQLAVAILAVESGVRQVNRETEGWLVEEGRVGKVVTDFGLFQFHYRTVEIFNLDADLLQTDLSYQVKAFFLLLDEKKKICSELGSSWWTCFHSKTPKYRLAYEKRVNWYLTLLGKESPGVSK